MKKNSRQARSAERRLSRVVQISTMSKKRAYAAPLIALTSGAAVFLIAMAGLAISDLNGTSEELFNPVAAIGSLLLLAGFGMVLRLHYMDVHAEILHAESRLDRATNA